MLIREKPFTSGVASEEKSHIILQLTNEKRVSSEG